MKVFLRGCNKFFLIEFKPNQTNLLCQFINKQLIFNQNQKFPFSSQIGDHRPQYAFVTQNGHQQQHSRSNGFQPPQFRSQPPPTSNTTNSGQTIPKNIDDGGFEQQREFLHPTSQATDQFQKQDISSVNGTLQRDESPMKFQSEMPPPTIKGKNFFWNLAVSKIDFKIELSINDSSFLYYVNAKNYSYFF